MSSLCGRYVRTFAEASHALPDGMHMNADYPFKLPSIVSTDGKTVTIQASRGGETKSFKIIRANGREWGYIEQSSSFESVFRRKPTRFKMNPFKDDGTPIPSNSAPSLPGF